ncbi:MAG: hypothetical protein LBS97_01775 [Treponema sp.]|jgi:ribonucleoside-triphosphate reductase|nr:hypothetical protein [Treponema sp.]
MTAVRSISAIDTEIADTKEALANVKGTETEVYARIVGYYRSVRNWNKGKRDEFNHRKLFSCGCGDAAETVEPVIEFKPKATAKNSARKGAPRRYELFARRTCPNCPPVKEFLTHSGLEGNVIDADTEEGFSKARELGVSSAPTVILYDDRGNLTGKAHNVAELSAFLGTERIAV